MKKQKLSNLTLGKKTISSLAASNLNGGEETNTTWSNITGNIFCFVSTGDGITCETTSFSNSQQGISCSWCPDGVGNNNCDKEQLVG